MMRLPEIISCLLVFRTSGQGVYYNDAPQQSGQRGRGPVPLPVPFHEGSQQQAYQQLYQSAYHQPYPQSYQQPPQNPWQNPDQYMHQQIAQDNQYLQPRKQDANEDMQYPQFMVNDGSLEIGMTVTARFNIDFRDVVIEQGTKGQIVSKRGESLLVKWEGVGDRLVVPSQLIPMDPDPDDEEVFYPKMKERKTEVQAPVEKENKEEKPKLSLARMEENKAKEALAAADSTAKEAPSESGKEAPSESGKGKGKRMGKGKKGKAEADTEAGVTV